MSTDRKDAVVEAVRDDLLRRSQIGIAKYGVTLERTDLDLRAWLQHHYEELLDAANYTKRCIMEIDAGGDPVTKTLAARNVMLEQELRDIVRSLPIQDCSLAKRLNKLLEPA